MTAIVWPKTNTPLKAVVFDMDDTLYPEREFVLSGFRAVAVWAQRHLGIPQNSGYDCLKRLFEQDIRGNTFNLWLAHFNIADDTLVPNLINVYRTHSPNIAPFAEMKALVEQLSLHVPVALLSDGYLEVQRRKFDALNLAPFFHTVLFSDQFGRENWKPSPVPFQAVLEKLTTNGPETVYIGDNPRKDFIGARQTGINTIWLKHARGEYFEDRPPTPQHDADIIVDHAANLFGLFGLD
ncbi:MAG: HAD family hydrolase [Ardenticatenaceae bacterium]|nr:HAD family hydrolase [Ardenticatenaceae bacterium]